MTGVTLRDYSTQDAAQQLIGMTRVASGVPCYQAALASETCDFWQATLPDTQVDVHWFRFIVSDGASTAYYGDDTAALDGGLGATTATPRDWSYALTVYDRSFTTPAWAKNAVVYQIFPDRFRNGDTKNDPQDGRRAVRPDRGQAAVERAARGVLPRVCHAVPAAVPFGGYNPGDREGPQGRDYYGGDLKGVRQSLEQLRLLGFNTIYLNPIFWSKSNHGYDTADYKTINPYFGTQKEFDLLVQQAHALHMHIILDGVFNHMSSDSPFFDRYHHSATVGACESTSSAYRSWFVFTNTHVPCTSGDYSGWFNFDSIPVLAKSNPAVFDYFVGAQDSVTRTWLKRGADGWRLDVMGDSSFPADYWTRFRQVVKATDPNALIVGELWPKDSTTLSFLDGQRADSTMNYRDRDAILGFLTTHTFDGKGLGDSGRVLAPSEFLSRLVSQQEDYAAPAYGALMNLIDSHDTTRALWTLSPGAENDAAAKAAGSADGKRRLRLASLVQYTLPGMPTVYYGDEVGVTGGDDPDNRRTYPWPQEGGKPDLALEAHYGALGLLRAAAPVLRDGTLVPLQTDDAAGTVAYGRKTGSQAAIVAIDKGDTATTLAVPVTGFVPDGTTFRALYGVGNAFGGTFTASGGVVQVPLAPLSAPRARQRRRRPDAAGRTDGSDGGLGRAGLGVAHLDRDTGSGLLRRLPQPLHRRRLRAGRHHLGDDVRRQRPPERGRAVLRRPGARQRRQRERSVQRGAGAPASLDRLVERAVAPVGPVHAVRQRRPHRLRPGLHRRSDRGGRADAVARRTAWLRPGGLGSARGVLDVAGRRLQRQLGQQRRVRGDDQPAAGGELRLRLPLLDHRRP